MYSVNVSNANFDIFPGNNSNITEMDEYIFDRLDVRAIFLTLYTFVFCCCFFGK